MESIMGMLVPVIGLFGVLLGTALTIWSTRALYERKEKERQNTVIALIDARLDFWHK